MISPSFWNSGLFYVSRRSRKEEGTVLCPSAPSGSALSQLNLFKNLVWSVLKRTFCTFYWEVKGNQKGWVTCFTPKQEAQWRREWIWGAPQILHLHSRLCVSLNPIPSFLSSALKAEFSLCVLFSLPNPGRSGFPWRLASKNWGDPGWNPSSPIPNHMTWYLNKSSVFK